VHAQLATVVALELGDVVRHVVDLARALGGVAADRPSHGLADAVGDGLPVGPGEVGRGGHRTQVGAALGRAHRRAGELAVRQRDPVALQGGVHPAHEVGTDLVAEPARARVDQHGQLPLLEPERRGRADLVDALDPLELEEVVARAERADLPLAALARPLRHRAGVRAGQPALRLRALEVLRGAQAATDERARALGEHVVERRAAQVQRAAAARAGRRRPPSARG
jgi:hypothetical protein